MRGTAVEACNEKSPSKTTTLGGVQYCRSMYISPYHVQYLSSVSVRDGDVQPSRTSFSYYTSKHLWSHSNILIGARVGTVQKASCNTGSDLNQTCPTRLAGEREANLIFTKFCFYCICYHQIDNLTDPFWFHLSCKGNISPAGETLSPPGGKYISWRWKYISWWWKCLSCWGENVTPEGEISLLQGGNISSPGGKYLTCRRKVAKCCKLLLKSCTKLPKDSKCWQKLGSWHDENWDDDIATLRPTDLLRREKLRDGSASKNQWN